MNFPRADWFLLPLSMRQQWWAASDYGRKEPSAELRREFLLTIARRKKEALHAARRTRAISVDDLAADFVEFDLPEPDRDDFGWFFYH